MNRRQRALVQFAVLAGVVVLLFLLFPATLRFVEMGAREVRYLWWLILLIALAVWLIWSSGRRPPK